MQLAVHQSSVTVLEMDWHCKLAVQRITIVSSTSTRTTLENIFTDSGFGENVLVNKGGGPTVHFAQQHCAMLVQCVWPQGAVASGLMMI